MNLHPLISAILRLSVGATLAMAVACTVEKATGGSPSLFVLVPGGAGGLTVEAIVWCKRFGNWSLVFAFGLISAGPVIGALLGTYDLVRLLIALIVVVAVGILVFVYRAWREYYRGG